MTVDDRLTIDLADILAVQFECRKCGATVSYPPAQWNVKAQQCPNCAGAWWGDSGMELREVQKLASALHALLAGAEDADFKMRLVIPHPE